MSFIADKPERDRGAAPRSQRWRDLDDADREALLERPAVRDDAGIRKVSRQVEKRYRGKPELHDEPAVILLKSRVWKIDAAMLRQVFSLGWPIGLTLGYTQALPDDDPYTVASLVPAAILAVLHFFMMVKADIREPLIYAAGQLLHIGGLAVSGAMGIQRKTAGSAQGLEGIYAKTAMGVMGLGGLLAVIGGILFVVVVIRAFLQRS